MDIAIDSMTFSKAAFIAVTLSAVYIFIWRPIYNLYFHPLSKYPGPKLWALSRFPHVRMMISGQSHNVILKLHQKYGPIVRIAPNELAVAEPTAWNDLNGHRKPGQLENYKDPNFNYNARNTILGVHSKEAHSHMRKLLARGFSAKAMQNQEAMIKTYIDLLIKQLHERSGPGKDPVNIVAWYNYTTFDIIGDLAFGEPFGSLQNGKEHPWISLIFDGLRLNSALNSLRRISPILVLAAAIFAPSGLREKAEAHKKLTKLKVAKRRELTESRPDFMQAMIGDGAEFQNLSDLEIEETSEVLIIAGSETTATALSGATFFLATNPDKLAIVTEEILSRFSSDGEITLLNTANLKYLNAVLEESMRLYPPVSGASPRVIAKGGSIIAGEHIPEDTVVGIWQWSMSRYDKYWARADEFIPERWLGGDPQFENDRRECLQPFSVGPRNRIGKNLAFAEMRLILARVIWNFKLDIDERSRDWLSHKDFILWDKPPMWIHLTPRDNCSLGCIGCRDRKTRCSGRRPCEKCVGRNEDCIYEEKERKVAVSADYLDQLHARLKSLEARLQAANNADNNGPVPRADHGSARESPNPSLGNLQDNDEDLTLYTEPEGLTNTLVTSEPQIKVHRYGHAAYLGHSSTLSFSRNVRNLLQQSSPVADPGSVSVERQDKSYATALPPIALDLGSIPLPRLSYAEYLTNTVLIHYGSLYSLFDPEKFLARLRAFYQQRAESSVPEPSLWHIQMLLVLGFGKSILAREHSELGPSGMIDFTRAIEAMPDIRRLYEEPLLSIEILSLAAIFMHATDMLQESYVTIGKAVRIAVTRIMNLAVPEVLKPTNVDYQRRLWWTVYCIDRKSTAMLGTLLVTRDEHISIPFPTIKEGDQAQNAFSIHVTLSSHLGKILDVIYGVHNQQRLNFVVEVKAILSRLAETFVVLQEHLDLDIHAPTQPVSRDAATLHLLFHQCVLLTVRPVLFSLLKPLLGEDSIGENRRLLSSPFESMLKMCVESSILILKIIFTLKSQMMCDVFLPYDIDALSSAAFALVLIDIIRPANELLWDLSQVMGLLDEYVSRHVAPAHAYRSDLLHILELHTKIRGNDGPAQADAGAERNAAQTPGLSRYAITNPAPTDISPDPVWSRIRHGIDPLVSAHLDTIRSVIDDLNVDSIETLDAVMLDGNFNWELDDLTEFL